jgi:hypothetical protein
MALLFGNSVFVGQMSGQLDWRSSSLLQFFDGALLTTKQKAESENTFCYRRRVLHALVAVDGQRIPA